VQESITGVVNMTFGDEKTVGKLIEFIYRGTYSYLHDGEVQEDSGTDPLVLHAKIFMAADFYAEQPLMSLACRNLCHLASMEVPEMLASEPWRESTRKRVMELVDYVYANSQSLDKPLAKDPLRASVLRLLLSDIRMPFRIPGIPENEWLELGEDDQIFKVYMKKHSQLASDIAFVSLKHLVETEVKCQARRISDWGFSKKENYNSLIYSVPGLLSMDEED
jgi:hypothetical protein